MKDATEATRTANRAALAQVPLADQQSFEHARRGFIEALGDKMITSADGRLVWTLKGYESLESEKAPDTVHRGLWRHALGLRLEPGMVIAPEWFASTSQGVFPWEENFSVTETGLEKLSDFPQELCVVAD